MKTIAIFLVLASALLVGCDSKQSAAPVSVTATNPISTIAVQSFPADLIEQDASIRVLDTGREVCWNDWYVSTSRHVFIAMEQSEDIERADKCTADSHKAIVGRELDGHWYIKLNRVKVRANGITDAKMLSIGYVQVKDIRIRQ